MSLLGVASLSWGLFTPATGGGCHLNFSMSSSSFSLVTGSLIELHTPQGGREGEYSQ